MVYDLEDLDDKHALFEAICDSLAKTRVKREIGGNMGHNDWATENPALVLHALAGMCNENAAEAADAGYPNYAEAWRECGGKIHQLAEEINDSLQGFNPTIFL